MQCAHIDISVGVSPIALNMESVLSVDSALPHSQVGLTPA